MLNYIQFSVRKGHASLSFAPGNNAYIPCQRYHARNIQIHSRDKHAAAVFSKVFRKSKVERTQPESTLVNTIIAPRRSIHRLDSAYASRLLSRCTRETRKSLLSRRCLTKRSLEPLEGTRTITESVNKSRRNDESWSHGVSRRIWEYARDLSIREMTPERRSDSPGVYL